MRSAAAGAVLLLALLGRRAVGEEAPAFELLDPDGKPVRFDAQAGDDGPVTVLVFADAGQERSKDALDDLGRLPEVDPGIAPRVRCIAVLPGSAGEEARAWVAARARTLPAVRFALDPDRSVTRRYGVIALPTTFVVRPGGEIAEVFPGRAADYAVRLRDAVRKVLGLAEAADDDPDPRADRGARHVHLAQALLKGGRLEEAEQEFTRAVELGDGDPDLLLRLGALRLALGRAADAATCFDRVLAADPDSRRASCGKACALALAGGDDAAAEAALGAETRRPFPDPEAFYHLALVLERTGRTEEAARAYRAAYERLRRRDWQTSRGG